MLLHQFILVFASAFRRFESVLLAAPERLRRLLSADDEVPPELQDAESEQAA